MTNASIRRLIERTLRGFPLPHLHHPPRPTHAPQPHLLTGKYHDSHPLALRPPRRGAAARRRHPARPSPFRIIPASHPPPASRRREGVTPIVTRNVARSRATVPDGVDRWPRKCRNLAPVPTVSTRYATSRVMVSYAISPSLRTIPGVRSRSDAIWTLLSPGVRYLGRQMRRPGRGRPAAGAPRRWRCSG